MLCHATKHWMRLSYFSASLIFPRFLSTEREWPFRTACSTPGSRWDSFAHWLIASLFNLKLLVLLVFKMVWVYMVSCQTSTHHLCTKFVFATNNLIKCFFNNKYVCLCLRNQPKDTQQALSRKESAVNMEKFKKFAARRKWKVSAFLWFRL